MDVSSVMEKASAEQKIYEMAKARMKDEGIVGLKVEDYPWYQKKMKEVVKAHRQQLKAAKAAVPRMTGPEQNEREDRIRRWGAR